MRFMVRKLLLFVLCFHLPFRGFSQGYNSVIISEIMADPTPVVGLPDVEYIELHNRTQAPVGLKGWILSIGTRSTVLPDSVILPGDFAVVCGRNDVAMMPTGIKAISVSTISLPNNGATLSLYNQNNQLVFSISYQLKWWTPAQNSGGYALEMIDTENPCGEAGNWRVSTDARGGTPGMPNSVQIANPDLEAPVVDRIDIGEGNQFRVVFDEKIDSLQATVGALIMLPGRTIVRRSVERPSFRTLVLDLDSPFIQDEKYQLEIRNITDCAGNLLRESMHKISLPMKADSGDIVINEILFNPKSNGVDFVELYNRSDKSVSLKNWELGNVRNDSAGVFRQITNQDVIIAPNSYLALTTDPGIVKEHYPSYKQRFFLEMASLPSYPNLVGGVILRDNNSKVFDRFDYNEDMHHELIADAKGVSLERVDASQPSFKAGNWHSAASTAGYATPGYANSQAIDENDEDDFLLIPESFTPGRPGVDDYVTIVYKQKFAGKMATIKIFDLNGRTVKHLLRNQLIGTSGDIRWDGTDGRGEVAPTGYYLVLIDTFDMNGNARQYKKRVVLARKTN